MFVYLGTASTQESSTRCNDIRHHDQITGQRTYVFGNGCVGMSMSNEACRMEDSGWVICV